MEQRSPEGVPEECRKQWLSGQAICRLSTGAAFRGGDVLPALPVKPALRLPALRNNRSDKRL